MRIVTGLLLTLGLLVCLLPARADLQITLDPVIPDFVPGSAGEPILSGTLTSLDLSQPLLLNDIDIELSCQSNGLLVGDSNVFFQNVVGILDVNNNGTYTGPLFGVQVDPATPPGLYTGTVSILGGADIFASDVLGSATFSINVVPEPGTASLGILFAAGSLGAFCRQRRRTRTLRASQ